jgi:hypothetical protein
VDHGTDDLCQWRVHNEVSSRASFTPDRVAIETTGGQVVAERSHARAGFDGHVLDKPWDWLHLVYFCGHTQCNYLTTPFSFAQPGYLSEEFGALAGGRPDPAPAQGDVPPRTSQRTARNRSSTSTRTTFGRFDPSSLPTASSHHTPRLCRFLGNRSANHRVPV